MHLRPGLALAASLLIAMGGCGRLGYETISAATSARDAAPDLAAQIDGGLEDGVFSGEDATNGTVQMDASALPDADVAAVPDAAGGYNDPKQAPGTLARYVGTSTRGFEDGPVATATMNKSFGLLWTPQGLYIADTGNAAIRLLRPNGQLETLVGRAGPGFEDGPVATAKLRYPVSLAQDAQGRLIIADEWNHALRRLNGDGTLETIAGTGTAGFKDGAAAQAQFNEPRALLADVDGSILIADKVAGLIRRLRNGMVTVVCGRPGETRGVVDGECSTTAKLQFPVHLEFDSNGDLLVCEWGPNVIRRITAAGVASTWAGKNNVRGYADGAPADSILSRPSATVRDKIRGGIWIIEQEGGHRIRYFDGTTIKVVAGPATSAFVPGLHREGADPSFAFPETAILDPAGCLLVPEGVPQISRYCP